MTTPGDLKPHQACACSRTRTCAFHRSQQKKVERLAQPVIDAQKVNMGIEDLRAKYAKPEPAPRPQPPRRSSKSNGWKR